MITIVLHRLVAFRDEPLARTTLEGLVRIRRRTLRALSFVAASSEFGSQRLEVLKPTLLADLAHFYQLGGRVSVTVGLPTI